MDHDDLMQLAKIVSGMNPYESRKGSTPAEREFIVHRDALEAALVAAARDLGLSDSKEN